MTLMLALLCAGTGLVLAEDNVLTPKEIEEGWLLLFDGKTTYGWTPDNEANAKDWVAEDGTLTCSTKAGFNHLHHHAVFKDFHLKLDFWVNTKGNSGVFFRAGLDGKPMVGPGGVISGYEAQIDDNDPRGLLYQTGGLYDVAPAQSLIKGENEWRSYDIVCEGDHIVTKINGQTQVDANLTKFSHGRIGIQHHNPGSQIKFKNIKLKPLGATPLFNGKDLTGWKAVDRAGASKKPTMRQQWSVRDGLLHVEVPKVPGAAPGGAGQIETEATFANFVFQADVRTNGRWLNSGIFYRTIPGQVWIGYESQIRNQWMGNDRTKPVDYGTGGIYNQVKTRLVVSNDKEFYVHTIACYGRQTSVWVNGYPVCEFLDQRPENESARAGYRSKAGTFALQSHDPTTNIDFKNLRVATLP